MDLEKDWIANAYEGMSRRQFLAQMSAAGVAVAGFAIASKAVAGEIIKTSADGLKVADGQVNSGGFRLPVFQARPAGAGEYPVVIVLPEIWGMHEYIKDVVRRFARRGFLSITFEPYARTGGVLHIEDFQALLKVVNAVPDAQVMADLDAIVAYVKKLPDARADRIGVTGFCRGGLYTFLFAAQSPDVKAAVPWYGQIKPAKTAGVRTAGPLDVAAQIHAPLLGLYGEADQGIPVADVKEMESALRAAGKTAEFVIYPDAPHAFHADYRPSYRENAAKDAWARCLAWFNEYLKR
ncbi:MAG: dienelactone hydrolase family protein [Desulfobacterales bacterium]|jgi:carboxymethylenebutenolidase|nr:dienelactone hydrolase family protein [Desulfobacterales bacterium]